MLLSDVCLSHIPGLTREQRGLGRLTLAVSHTGASGSWSQGCWVKLQWLIQWSTAVPVWSTSHCKLDRQQQKEQHETRVLSLVYVFQLIHWDPWRRCVSSAEFMSTHRGRRQPRPEPRRAFGRWRWCRLWWAAQQTRRQGNQRSQTQLQAERRVARWGRTTQTDSTAAHGDETSRWDHPVRTPLRYSDVAGWAGLSGTLSTNTHTHRQTDRQTVIRSPSTVIAK